MKKRKDIKRFYAYSYEGYDGKQEILIAIKVYGYKNDYRFGDTVIFKAIVAKSNRFEYGELVKPKLSMRHIKPLTCCDNFKVNQAISLAKLLMI